MDSNNINAVNGLFCNYVNPDAAAEQAACSLRDTICITVINNTAIAYRVNEDFYEILMQTAQQFCKKKKISLYKDDRYIESFTFIGNSQQILEELQRFFYEVIIDYKCCYADKISYKEQEGFCWEYDGMKIAIV